MKADRFRHQKAGQQEEAERRGHRHVGHAATKTRRTPDAKGFSKASPRAGNNVEAWCFLCGPSLPSTHELYEAKQQVAHDPLKARRVCGVRYPREEVMVVQSRDGMRWYDVTRC